MDRHSIFSAARLPRAGFPLQQAPQADSPCHDRVLRRIAYGTCSRWRGLESESAQKIIGSIYVGSKRILILKIHAERHRDVIVVLNPMRSINRDVQREF